MWDRIQQQISRCRQRASETGGHERTAHRLKAALAWLAYRMDGFQRDVGMGCAWQGNECDKWQWTALVTVLEPEDASDLRLLDRQAKQQIARYIGAAPPTVEPDLRQRYTSVGPATTSHNVSPDEHHLLVETNPEQPSMEILLHSHRVGRDWPLTVKDSTGHADCSPIYIFDQDCGGVVLDVPYACVTLETGKNGWLIDGVEPLKPGWARSSQRN